MVIWNLEFVTHAEQNRVKVFTTRIIVTARHHNAKQGWEHNTILHGYGISNDHNTEPTSDILMI